MEWPSTIQQRQLDEAHAALRKWASLWDLQLGEAHAALRNWASLWGSLWVSAARHRQPVDVRTEAPGRTTDDSEDGIRDLLNTIDPSPWGSLRVSAAGHRHLVDVRKEALGRKTDDSEDGIRDLLNTIDPPE